MANRVLNFIRDIEREAEHQRRCDRIRRSDEMHAAACDLAIEHGKSLSYTVGRYVIGDAECLLLFFPATNVLMRSMTGKRRLERIELNAEVDLYDVVLMFTEGAFTE